jgi:aminodeoxyfutalosine deaminase
MSVESFIRALPKVDLHVQLEGAISKDYILMVADQTDIARNYKKPKMYRDWLELLKNPNFNHLDEMARETTVWVRHPDDIARAIYDLAVSYNKQNVKYAEIAFIPALYTDLEMSFQELMEALNDGADRAFRAWGVRIGWVLAIPRERPRKSDDIARWATSVTAQKGNVVAMSLVGREDAQPIAQFKKAFSTVEKKNIPRITHVYSYPDSDSFMGVVENVQPSRITDAWGLLDDEEAIQYCIDHHIPVMMTPSRELKLGRIKSLSEFPLKELLAKGLNVILGSGMPILFNTTLNDEYVAAVEQMGLSLDELLEMIRSSIHAAYMPHDAKDELLKQFDQTVQMLREEHLATG